MTDPTDPFLDEMLADPEQKIARPRQVYLGERGRTMPGL